MRVAVLNHDVTVLTDPWVGKPFANNANRLNFVINYDEADYILCPLHYLNFEKEFMDLTDTDLYKTHGHKFVVTCMHDNSAACYYERKITKLNCQPLYGKETNQTYNNTVVPLHMRHYDYALQQNTEHIKLCRNQPKLYEYVFIGQISYAGRNWLKAMANRADFLYRETSPIWGISNTEERVSLMEAFCHEVSTARFSFCPRGVGTSSFRLYQSLMVGSVPIVWGQKEYPFSHLIDWDKIVIDISENLDEPKKGLGRVERISDEEYAERRQAGIEAWDNYLSCKKADEVVYNILESKL